MNESSRYTIDTSRLHGKQKEDAERINFVINAAFLSPGTVKKVSAGYYFVVIDCELVELNRNEELNGSAKWIAYEGNQKWYSDPEETLSDLKWRLGL
jgi:hypothetical protein